MSYHHAMVYFKSDGSFRTELLDASDKLRSDIFNADGTVKSIFWDANGNLRKEVFNADGSLRAGSNSFYYPLTN